MIQNGTVWRFENRPVVKFVYFFRLRIFLVRFSPVGFYFLHLNIEIYMRQTELLTSRSSDIYKSKSIISALYEYFG
jgi:hypothetical protein